MPFLTEAFEKIDSSKSSDRKAVKDIADSLGFSGFPSDLLKLHEAVSTDLRFTNPDDLVIDRAFATLLADEDLSREYMKQADRYVTNKSRELLKEIDEAKKLGKRVKIPYVIVGDGPNTSSAVIQLGAFNSVGIISNRKRLCEAWDRPIFINSSSEEVNPDSPALPLKRAGTTRVTPRVFQNTARPKDMVNSSNLTIKYTLTESDGSERPVVKKYIPGPALRKVSMHNEICHADYFLMGQDVLSERTRISEDGKSLIITIRDLETGQLREFENDDSLFITGTGKEVLKGVDERTVELYRLAESTVDFVIDTVTRKIAAGEEIRPSFVINGLPQILSPTMIDKLYRLWVTSLTVMTDIGHLGI